MTPAEFLNLLWQDKPAESYILIWTLPGKQSHWFRSAREAAELARTRSTDVYVGVGLAKQDYGRDHRCLSTEVVGITGLWADFDIKSAAHPKNLPVSIDEVLTLISESLPPTLIVETGNGLQAWWLFKEPWIFESENDRQEAEILSSRFQTLLRYRSSQRGWGFDRLSDLARVLRIPGTMNGEDPLDPKPVTMHSFGAQRYNPSDIQDYLDDLSICDPPTERSTAHAQQFADQQLIINLNARIPAERLDHWQATDSRFKNTWFRQRNDLNDQSQSGYDMALACFGVSAGLSDQEIVDLIVHHRALHRVKPRTRLDYFERTLAKARSHDSGGRLLQGADQVPSASDTAGEQECAIDPATAMAKNWERISAALGFRILRLIKITGKNPIYRMECEDCRIEFPTIQKLTSQMPFRCAVAAAINKLPHKLKPKFWEEIVQLMLASLTEEDGGEEMELEGSARIYLTQYLSEVAFIETVEGEGRQTARNPLIVDGSITVCASNFQVHIAKTTGQNVAIPQVAAMLSAVGAKSFRHRGKFPEQSRWRLPVSEFDPAEFSAQYREDINDAG